MNFGDKKRQRELEEEIAKAWKDLHNVEVTPERRARMEKFEKELFNPDLLIPKSDSLLLRVKYEKIMTLPEADLVVRESRHNRKVKLDTVVGDLSLRYQNQPEIKKYKNLDELFEGDEE